MLVVEFDARIDALVNERAIQLAGRIWAGAGAPLCSPQ